MIIQAKMNTQPKSKVYEKNGECILPKDFIRGVYLIIRPFVDEVYEV